VSRHVTRKHAKPITLLLIAALAAPALAVAVFLAQSN
jgi:hypothetical protein